MIYVRILSDFLFFFFALFAITSTFSIAVAQIALGVSLLLYLIILYLKKEFRLSGHLKLFYISIGLYIFWMVLASLFSEAPLKSFLSLKEEWLFCAIPIGIYLLQKESFRTKIFISFAVAVCLVSLYGIAQHFSGIYWFKKTPPVAAFDYGYMVKGFFPHRLTFGNYFATASMFLLGYLAVSWKSLSSAWRLFLFVDILLAVIVTFFSYSYGPMLTIVGTVFVFGLIQFRKYTLYLLAFILISGPSILVLNESLVERITNRIQVEMDITDEASRIYIWDNALKMTIDNPVFGIGQGNFYPQFEKNMPDHRIHVHAHNDFINFAAIAGIPGFIFYTFMWGLILKLMYRGWRKNKYLAEQRGFLAAGFLGATAFFITSLTEATFADEEVRQMLMFVWAFGLFALASKANIERN